MAKPIPVLTQQTYNAYKIELWAEDLSTVEDAIALAEKEIKLRPTAQAYDLLAWSYFKNNEKLYYIRDQEDLSCFF